MDRLITQRRFNMALLAAFGVLGLVIAAIGIYGVMAYTVSQRTREIGVRLALGATERSIVGAVLGRGLRLTAIGVAIGVTIALALSRLIVGMLYGVTAIDPATFVLVPPLLFAIAALACYIPARRATRVDPVVALRSE
jgi:putative ABC transport system permease protein